MIEWCVNYALTNLLLTKYNPNNLMIWCGSVWVCNFNSNQNQIKINTLSYSKLTRLSQYITNKWNILFLITFTSRIQWVLWTCELITIMIFTWITSVYHKIILFIINKHSFEILHWNCKINYWDHQSGKIIMLNKHVNSQMIRKISMIILA